jgi:uncharacterized protein (TIGR02266 family)
MDPVENKRQYPRAPVRVEILCDELKADERRGIGILCFYSNDISIGGIFLETTVLFKIGDTLHLQFTLPKLEKPLRVVGKVVRTNESNPNALPGIGIEFEHLGFEAKKIIEGYVVDETARQL